MFEAETKELAKELDSINFNFDGFVYNPLDYAWENHKEFLEKYLNPESEILLLGMNPGPFGMMQDGVPYGEINFVKNYLKICNKVTSPIKTHPKRPVLGMESSRSEVSGRRLWTFISNYYPDPKNFFKHYSVMNYCPLGFVDGGKTGKNITPDKLDKEDRTAIEHYCDDYLVKLLNAQKYKNLIGIGRYAEKKLINLAKRTDYTGPIGFVLHPSPMNPKANKGDWGEKAKTMLIDQGAWYA